MKKILKVAFCATTLLLAHAAFAQTDAENIANAFSALSLNHNCEDAMHYLNQVNPDSRLSSAYLLAMARTQDCKKNTEQAIYYYNKYLSLNVGTDSIIRRVAELKDMSSQKAGANNEAVVAKNTYQSASKNKKRRHYLLDDNYYSSGISYGKGLSGSNSPYGTVVAINASDGIVMMHNKAVLDINATSAFLSAPNNTWFDNALGAPAGSGGLGNGFAELLTVGFNPVLINNKHVALTVGAMLGINLYLMNANVAYSGSTSINDKFTACYGIKSNLYLGEYCMVFMHLILNSATTADITNDISTYTVPANYNMLNIGVSYKFDSWW